MVETSALSVLFLTDALCGSSPIISLAVKTLPDTESLKQSEIGTSNESVKEVAFILTRDSHVVLVDSSTGNMISQPIHPMEESTAVSLYIIGKHNSLSTYILLLHPCACSLIRHLCYQRVMHL